MYLQKRDVHKERFLVVSVLIDVGDRAVALLVIDSRQVSVTEMLNYPLWRLAGLAFPLAVVHHRIVHRHEFGIVARKVGMKRQISVGVYTRVVREEVLHLVEPVVDGEILRLVAQVPLTGIVGAITVLLKEFGDSWHFLANVVWVAWSDHRRKGRTYRDTAGDERGATRRATRLSVPIRETRALCCETVQIRCRRAPRNAAAIATEVAPADIVGHKNNNVWFFICRTRTRRRQICRLSY